MIIKLTPDQRRKFETVLWLTDPISDRGTGRTHLLALAYIKHSIDYKTSVNIINHNSNHPQATKELLDHIYAIVTTKMKGYSIKISNRNSNRPHILVEPKDTYKSTKPSLWGKD